MEAQGSALVGSALLLGAFLLTHRRYPSDFSWFWVAGWTIYTIRFVFDLAISMVGPTYLLQVGVNEAVATSAVLLLVAVDRLGETDRTDDRLFVGLWALLSAWILVVPLVSTSFLLLHTPLYVAFGLIQFVTAYLFYRYLAGQGFLSTPLIVGALTV